MSNCNEKKKKKANQPLFPNPSNGNERGEMMGVDLKVHQELNMRVRDWDEFKVHKFTDIEKEFIVTWLNTYNLDIVKETLDMSNKDVMKIFNNFYISKEISRLEKEIALYRTSQKIMSLDEIQSYLSTWILDYDIPISQRLSSKDKLEAIKLLEKIKEYKDKAFDGDLEVIDVIPNEEELDNLSINDIKKILDERNLKGKLEEKKEEILKIESGSDKYMSQNEKQLIKQNKKK